MNSMRWTLPLACFLLISSRCFAQSSGGDPTWDSYAAAQKKLQVAMHHLMTLRWPGLKPVLDMTRDLQLAEVDERTMKYYFLKENYPDRLVRHQDLEAYANFPWSEMDGEALRQKNPDFQKLEENIQNLKKAREDSPLWPQVREKFDSLTRSQDPEYLEIIARFNRMTDEVKDMLSIPE